MDLRIYNSIRWFLLCTVFCMPIHTSIANETFRLGTVAQTATFRWSSENWFTEEHPRIAEFTVRDDGSAYGMTETGIPFTQENVETMLNMRIQKFVMQDHFHYIIDGEVIYSFEDFSIHLAKMYLEVSQSPT